MRKVTLDNLNGCTGKNHVCCGRPLTLADLREMLEGEGYLVYVGKGRKHDGDRRKWDAHYVWRLPEEEQ